MSTLSNFTDDQLREELTKREQIAKETDKPKMVESPDLSKLRDLCQEYIDRLANNDYSVNLAYQIFEAALEAFYGDSVLDWVKKQLW